MHSVPFADRRSAGRLLAEAVAKLKPQAPIVYALPRGGVPVAIEVAARLKAPLDLLLVRKLGAPHQPELAAGAIVDGERPDIVLNDDVVRVMRMSQTDIDAAAARELKVIERRRTLYLGDAPPLPARGRTAIIVDDGVATGASMRAAIAAMRRRGPGRLIVAVPVAAPETIADLRPDVDDIVCLHAPPDLGAVGFYYEDFRQLEDDDVVRMLKTMRGR